MVAGPLEGGAEDGTDPAGADNADVEPGRSLDCCRHVTHARNASASDQHVAFVP